MKVSRLRKGLLFAIAASTLALGCELIVDFDRTKIPVDSTDGSVPTSDGSIDATLDTNQPDTSTADAADTSDAASEADAPDGD